MCEKPGNENKKGINAQKETKPINTHKLEAVTSAEYNPPKKKGRV